MILYAFFRTTDKPSHLRSILYEHKLSNKYPYYGMSAKRKPTNFIRYACILQRIYFILSESPRKKVYYHEKYIRARQTHPINKKYKSYLSLKTLAFLQILRYNKVRSGKTEFFIGCRPTESNKEYAGIWLSW